MMLTHPVTSQNIPKRSVHKQPTFSITKPLNKVPIIIVRDKTLTKRQTHIDNILIVKLNRVKHLIKYYVATTSLRDLENFFMKNVYFKDSSILHIS